MQGVITEIQIQKNNKERASIFIEGEYVFSCSLELIYRYNLSKGSSVDEEKFKRLISDDNIIKCKNDALNVVGRSYKTEKEMKDKLLLKGYEIETIENVMEFLKNYKFIDDEKYTEAYIKDRIGTEGSSRIKYSLIKKGIPEAIIMDKIELLLQGKEKNAAYELAKKKYNILIKSEKDRSKLYKKLGDFLFRKGYSYADIKPIIKEIIGGEDNTYED